MTAILQRLGKYTELYTEKSAVLRNTKGNFTFFLFGGLIFLCSSYLKP